MAQKPVEDGGKECSNKDAAACLAQGHPKSGQVPVAWGQKDQQNDGDGDDDDARSRSFNKG